MGEGLVDGVGGGRGVVRARAGGELGVDEGLGTLGDGSSLSGGSERRLLRVGGGGIGDLERLVEERGSRCSLVSANRCLRGDRLFVVALAILELPVVDVGGVCAVERGRDAGLGGVRGQAEDEVARLCRLEVLAQLDVGRLSRGGGVAGRGPRQLGSGGSKEGRGNRGARG